MSATVNPSSIESMVGEQRRQALRGGQQAGRFGGKRRNARVRAAHDGGKAIERLVCDPVDADEGVEAALVADVAELHAGDVVHRRASMVRFRRKEPLKPGRRRAC